jgi:hypothetical protein
LIISSAFSTSSADGGGGVLAVSACARSEVAGASNRSKQRSENARIIEKTWASKKERVSMKAPH